MKKDGEINEFIVKNWKFETKTSLEKSAISMKLVNFSRHVDEIHRLIKVKNLGKN